MYQSKRELKIAIIQPNTRELDLDYNFKISARMLKKAASKGAEIAVTPECMLDGYSFDSPEFQRQPEEYCINPGKSKFYQDFQKIAEQLGMYLIIGMSLVGNEDGNGTLRNAAVLFSPDGKEVGKYFKSHSTYNNLEAIFYKHGESFPVFELDFCQSKAKVGIMICYDRQLPEPARLLRLNGAEVIFNPAATGNFLRGWNTRLVQTRAYENKCFVVSVNHAFPRITGRSFVARPDGKLIHRSPWWQCVRVVTVDLTECTNKADAIKTRRPTLYSGIIEESKY